MLNRNLLPKATRMQQQGIWTTSASAYNNGFSSGHNSDVMSAFTNDVTPESKTNIAFRRTKSETSCASLVTPKQLKSKPRRRLGFFSRSKSTECHQVRPKNGQCYLVVVSGLLPPANEVWGKVIFLHLFVILFRGGGGSASVHAGIPPHWEAPPHHRACWEMRAVRILLECNLVLNCFVWSLDLW